MNDFLPTPTPPVVAHNSNVSLRADGRTNTQLRPIKITRGFTTSAAGSVLIEFGNTKVLCTASISEGVPGWKRDSGEGWVTAEYAMLPGSTEERNRRESVRGHIGGRTHEISRLIGRSLRGCIDYKALGENTITLDCDVLQADGGTRTASITGAYIALVDAVNILAQRGRLAGKKPIISQVAAVSVGIIDNQIRVDLPYEEDSRAQVDFNVVANENGDFIEVQGTGEGAPYTRTQLNELLDAALTAIAELTELQRQALES